MQTTVQYDRAVEDVGNAIGLEHVNTRVPDQHLATLFYVTGLGLTRDPYLMTGVTNMWMNVGRSQFHLPTGTPQVVRGHTGLVMPDRIALLHRLEQVREPLGGTKFTVAAHADHVAVTCPWGNAIRVFEPGPRFPGLRLGIPYVQLDVPRGTSEGIVRFYNEIMAMPAQTMQAEGERAAHVTAGPGQVLIYRECDNVRDDFDGHHIAIYIADFSGPYRKLGARSLISREDDQHQYRFERIVDPQDGRVLFSLEHEVRSLLHPLYGRPFVNRNPAQTNNRFAPGYEDAAWAMPIAG